MNINELVTFKAVVDKKGFSKAAEFLGYSQSNVTKHIKKIEETVGFELFERGWKSNLTKEGELFYKEVNNLLDHWKTMCVLSQEIGAEQIGEIRIGIIEPLAKRLLPQIIEWLRINRPKLNATFEMGNTWRLCELVQNDELDCAFCGSNVDLPNELEFKGICEDEIVLIALKNHELLKKETIEFKDVLNYPLIYGDKTCISNQKFMEVLKKRNLLSKLKTHYICSNQLLIPEILDKDQIGIVPSSVVNTLKSKIDFLPISAKNFKIIYGIITPKKKYNYLNTTIQAVTELVLNSLTKDS